MSHEYFDYSRWLDDDGHEEAEWFTFQARVSGIVDGDTLDLTVDLGFQSWRSIRVRLGGLDTAEIHNTSRDSEAYQTGIEHRDYVTAWTRTQAQGSGYAYPFVVTTAPATGKYGRYIAVVRAKASGDVLNADLVEEFPGVKDE